MLCFYEANGEWEAHHATLRIYWAVWVQALPRMPLCTLVLKEKGTGKQKFNAYLTLPFMSLGPCLSVCLWKCPLAENQLYAIFCKDKPHNLDITVIYMYLIFSCSSVDVGHMFGEALQFIPLHAISYRYHNVTHNIIPQPLLHWLLESEAQRSFPPACQTMSCWYQSPGQKTVS